MQPIARQTSGLLKIEIYDTRTQMGRAAAALGIARAKQIIAQKGSVNIVFAAAPSQFELYESLLASDLEFSKVNAFHMDEYIGLAKDAPQGFGNLLRARLFSKKHFQSVHYINGQNADSQAECNRYAQLLSALPPDLILHGIGENGHLAFNDPPCANFDDPVLVKVVEMDEICRNQQVNDGCFATIKDVPTQAIFLTIPILSYRTHSLIVTVPGASKKNAVCKTVVGPVSTACPASILKQHLDATLFLDRVAAEKICGACITDSAW